MESGSTNPSMFAIQLCLLLRDNVGTPFPPTMFGGLRAGPVAGPANDPSPPL
jgi:hypothetical protein